MSIEEKLQQRLQILSTTKKNATLQNETSRTWIKQNLSLLGISATMLDTCIKILEYMGDLKIVWLHLQECTGCSESLLRTESPNFEILIFDFFKIQYHDLLMTPSGHGATKSLDESLDEKYVLLVEGSIPIGFAQDYITLGNRNGYEEVSHLINHAEAIFAVGTCSSFGGIQSAYPNPTNGHALSELFEHEIINIPGCPPSDKNIIATLVYYYLFQESPNLDNLKRPQWAYNKSVHDLCERKSFFMSGDFVESFDDPNMANGYCLYKVGCKGPYTYNNCPKVKFNAKTSWPVQGGHGCIGCSEPNFWDNFGNIERPLSNESFFLLNPKFLPPNTPVMMQNMRQFSVTKIQNMQNYSSISTQNNVTKSYIVNTESDFLTFTQSKKFSKSFLLDFSPNQSCILLQENDTITILSNFCFEINPKIILAGYENKNKQSKKLYQNYKKVFQNRFQSLMKLNDTSVISHNILDLFSLFYLILDDRELDFKIIDTINASIKNINQNLDSKRQFHDECLLQEFLYFASNFKFPFVSDLNFKCKQENNKIVIDFNKALSLAMAYRIGGLDIYGICYSILHGIMNTLSQTLGDIQSQIFSNILHMQESSPKFHILPVVLRGEILHSEVAQILLLCNIKQSELFYL
ncbi:hydrogenase (NiFe) small subunit [Helicobacter didelphidarum]|uniref:Hydrogenase (NiFe) small subunit n=2 Tax=Helicobacter didelphidarum TaxID=2040648 RepID=A0A3D8IMP5_9HELI|nr:hydrogenase (NiFe) small subunit [Helicobacter didelphidarum]